MNCKLLAFFEFMLLVCCMKLKQKNFINQANLFLQTIEFTPEISTTKQIAKTAFCLLKSKLNFRYFVFLTFA